MRFLVPLGGVTDPDFGILTTPGMYGIPAGIKAGLSWAGDNQAFTKSFYADRFSLWLKTMEPYRDTCLFITCPDAVGSAEKTLALLRVYADKFSGWPLAFVAQDGQEALDFPPSDQWQTLFIGGSTIWKMSQSAVDCIKRAQKLGKSVHIGRVNWYRRYQHFASLPGSDNFTCDGTRTRYGKDQALLDWSDYAKRTKQLSFNS